MKAMKQTDRRLVKTINSQKTHAQPLNHFVE